VTTEFINRGAEANHGKVGVVLLTVSPGEVWRIDLAAFRAAEQNGC
jgi:hypothetical protein